MPVIKVTYYAEISINYRLLLDQQTHDKIDKEYKTLTNDESKAARSSECTSKG